MRWTNYDVWDVIDKRHPKVLFYAFVHDISDKPYQTHT